MIPLSGAQLHKSVDFENQSLQPDLKSGRQEDRLAFRLNFMSKESLYFRVAQLNELKGWMERLEKVRERERERENLSKILETPLLFMVLHVGTKKGLPLK